MLPCFIRLIHFFVLCQSKAKKKFLHMPQIWLAWLLIKQAQWWARLLIKQAQLGTATIDKTGTVKTANY
jgi:hypothetical protein